MTEAEWLASDDPAAMLRWIAGHNANLAEGIGGGPQVSDRKLRLFVAAGLRVVIPESPLVPTVEAMADNLAIPEDRRWWPTIADVGSSARTLVNTQDPFARPMLAHLLRDIVGNPFRPVVLPLDCGHSGCVVQHQPAWLTPTVVSLARAAYDERYRQWVGRKHDHDDATGWEENGHLDPFRLALVADALEEAGCDSADLLQHLRGWATCPMCLGKGICTDPLKGSNLVRMWPCQMCVSSPGSTHGKSAGIVPVGPHVRGCWAIDLLTGRE